MQQKQERLPKVQQQRSKEQVQHFSSLGYMVGGVGQKRMAETPQSWTKTAMGKSSMHVDDCDLEAALMSATLNSNTRDQFTHDTTNIYPCPVACYWHSLAGQMFP